MTEKSEARILVVDGERHERQEVVWLAKKVAVDAVVACCRVHRIHAIAPQPLTLHFLKRNPYCKSKVQWK